MCPSQLSESNICIASMRRNIKRKIIQTAARQFQSPGLGEPSVEKRAYGNVSINIPVRTKDRELGVYSVVVDGVGVVSIIIYHGSHPLVSREGLERIGLSCSRSDRNYISPGFLERQDGWEGIYFPGIPNKYFPNLASRKKFLGDMKQRYGSRQ